MNPQKILIIEDDLFLRELYADVLSQEGYAVASASDGEEGLKKIKEGGYDMVFIDIILPKMNGLEVVKQIHANPPQNPNKFIIFLTNLDKDEEIKEAQKLGNGFLIKSQITPGTLVETVKKYLNPT